MCGHNLIHTAAAYLIIKDTNKIIFLNFTFASLSHMCLIACLGMECNAVYFHFVAISQQPI